MEKNVLSPRSASFQNQFLPTTPLRKHDSPDEISIKAFSPQLKPFSLLRNYLWSPDFLLLHTFNFLLHNFEGVWGSIMFVDEFHLKFFRQQFQFFSSQPLFVSTAYKKSERRIIEIFYRQNFASTSFYVRPNVAFFCFSACCTPFSPDENVFSRKIISHLLFNNEIEIRSLFVTLIDVKNPDNKLQQDLWHFFCSGSFKLHALPNKKTIHFILIHL